MPAAWIAASPAATARASASRSASGRAAYAARARSSSRSVPFVRQLHHQEHPPVGLPEIEHAADVRVVDLARQLHLARQPLRPRPLARKLRAHDLDRHRLPSVASCARTTTPMPPRPMISSIA